MLEKLIFLMQETFYTSLKIKTINNPFDFLAPGKSSGNSGNPVFPTKPSNKTYTLVLDLDETLVHFAYVFLLITSILYLVSFWW